MNDLKSLRVKKRIPTKDIINVVQRLYPKYDKTMQSKCENSELYGVALSPDAMDALYNAFDKDRETAPSAPKKDRHRLTCAIRARLEKPVYDRLQQLIADEGYATAQDWLTVKIIAYLREKGAQL